MADVGDEMPPAAEQSEAAAARIGKRKEPATPTEDQLLSVLDMITSSAKSCAERVSEVKAKFKTLGLTIVQLGEAAAAERRRAEEYQATAHASGEELQNARKALIEGFLQHKLISKESSDIGIKRMGELEEGPFKHACRRKYGDGDDPEAKAALLLSSWQDELKDASWRPYKTIEVDGKTEEVVDENDDKLMQLKMEYGHDVYMAVKIAVAELRGYDTAGGYPVPKLWNFGEARKATMVEALNCVFDHLKK